MKQIITLFFIVIPMLIISCNRGDQPSHDQREEIEIIIDDGSVLRTENTCKVQAGDGQKLIKDVAVQISGSGKYRRDENESVLLRFYLSPGYVLKGSTTRKNKAEEKRAELLPVPIKAPLNGELKPTKVHEVVLNLSEYSGTKTIYISAIAEKSKYPIFFPYYFDDEDMELIYGPRPPFIDGYVGDNLKGDDIYYYVTKPWKIKDSVRDLLERIDQESNNYVFDPNTDPIYLWFEEYVAFFNLGISCDLASREEELRKKRIKELIEKFPSFSAPSMEEPVLLFPRELQLQLNALKRHAPKNYKEGYTFPKYHICHDGLYGAIIKTEAIIKRYQLFCRKKELEFRAFVADGK